MASEQPEADALSTSDQEPAEGTATALADAPAPAESGRVATEAELHRIFKLSVPVIVQLARRPMSIAIIRSLAPGAILEFERSVDEELELLINNRQVARGTCVKVDENFGLRISAIVDPAQRIRTLGAQP